MVECRHLYITGINYDSIDCFDVDTQEGVSLCPTLLSPGDWMRLQVGSVVCLCRANPDAQWVYLEVAGV